MQAFVNLIYPNLCLCCSQVIAKGAALCPNCWGDIDFIRGACCQYCGADALERSGAENVTCENCQDGTRPWQYGRSAVMYNAAARDLLLGLKHAYRHDVILPAARWMADAAAPICPKAPLLIPVPLHWRRLLARKYNQSALLGHKIGKLAGYVVVADGLLRVKYTVPFWGNIAKMGVQN